MLNYYFQNMRSFINIYKNSHETIIKNFRLDS